MMHKHIPRGAPPLFALFLLLGFLFSRCDKPPDPPLTEEEKLPAATQEGKGTFGCLVDGKAWVPKSGGLLQPGIEAAYNEITGQLGITATYWDTPYFQTVSMGAIAQNVGLIPLNQNQGGTVFSDSSSLCPVPTSVNPDTNIGWKEYSHPVGKIEITYISHATGIISGKFEFDAYSGECQDTIHITQGRFDIKYK